MNHFYKGLSQLTKLRQSLNFDQSGHADDGRLNRMGKIVSRKNNFGACVGILRFRIHRKICAFFLSFFILVCYGNVKVGLQILRVFACCRVPSDPLLLGVGDFFCFSGRKAHIIAESI
jgi:hypothetical protein